MYLFENCFNPVDINRSILTTNKDGTVKNTQIHYPVSINLKKTDRF
ncbi:MAG: hypothetical protein WBP45_03175 [Daejeonella sp.]